MREWLKGETEKRAKEREKKEKERKEKRRERKGGKMRKESESERERERERESEEFPEDRTNGFKREGEKARVREATRRGSVFFAGYRSCTVEAPSRATESPWRRMPRD